MPQGFIGDISLLEFRAGFVESLLHRSFVGLLKECTKVWVKTAENIIPSWSGMSRGTLVKLGAQVGVNISLFVDSGALPPKGPGDRSKLGEQQSQGRLVIERGRYGFVYASNVFHLAVNENADATIYGFRLRQPGPYQFRQAADNAFNDSLRKGLNEFPFNLILRRGFKITSQHIG